MRPRAHVIPALFTLSIAFGGLPPSAHGAPPAAPASTAPTPPAATSGGSGSGHGSRHYGHFRHYGHYRHYGHFRHYGTSGHGQDVAGPDASPNGGGGSAGPEESFMRDGRRYYWHYRGGHRFYSSRPEPGDNTGPDMGVGQDLDAPLSRTEQAQRAARVHQAQLRLAAIEKRVAHQRHLRNLEAKAARPKHRHK